MATKGLTTALTLYRCGTLTFSQAAARAGRNAESFARVLDQYEIPYQHDHLASASADATTNGQIRAD